MAATYQNQRKEVLHRTICDSESAVADLIPLNKEISSSSYMPITRYVIISDYGSSLEDSQDPVTPPSLLCGSAETVAVVL
ncbi:hypothetical protein TREES_T100006477 [Tupaia chinensis]|uniref:Uncharacterized protein n=1 Tax=Tupaia chinensis TaxID=246437 RepID=L9KVF3_TUPCH|nr:hypothetical protein TREES_T100006477 [Tupaia chinensis]